MLAKTGTIFSTVTYLIFFVVEVTIGIRMDAVLLYKNASSGAILKFAACEILQVMQYFNLVNHIVTAEVNN